MYQNQQDYRLIIPDKLEDRFTTIIHRCQDLMNKPLTFWVSSIFIKVAFPFSQSNTSMCDGFCSSLSLFILRFTLIEIFKQKINK